MTDEVGLLEHAEGIVPRYEHGYCLDDVARGLVVLSRDVQTDSSPSAPGGPDLDRLAERYVDFPPQAQAPDGRFHNRMGLDRRWQDEPGLGDWWGRALWGLGTAALRAARSGIRADRRPFAARAAAARRRRAPWPSPARRRRDPGWLPRRQARDLLADAA